MRSSRSVEGLKGVVVEFCDEEICWVEKCMELEDKVVHVKRG